MKIIKIFFAAGVMLIVLLRVSSITNSLNPFIDSIKPLFLHPFATKKEKMEMKYPILMDVIDNIKASTPDNSTVYISEEIEFGNPLWALTNLRLASALLYPRKVIQVSDVSQATAGGVWLDVNNLQLK